jgi:hypothetical protein
VVFQRRLRAEDLLGFGRILHAGKLDHDAVRALLLDQRLGHAELVDAIAQGGQVAGDDGSLLFLQRGFADARVEREARRRGGAVDDFQRRLVAEFLGLVDILRDFVRRRGAVGLRAQHHDDALRAGVDRLVADLGIAQRGADIVDVARLHLVQRRLLVDFHQEVHAALQVEAERHAVRTDRAQPAGHGAGEVQRDDILVAEFGLERIGRSQLHFGVREAREQAVAVELHVLERDLLGLQDAEHFLLQRRVDRRAAIGGNLHGRLLRVDDRQRVDDAEQHDHGDKDVFPAGKIVHVGHSRAAFDTRRRFLFPGIKRISTCPSAAPSRSRSSAT